MIDEAQPTPEFKSRIEGRFLVWVSEVDEHIRADSLARISIDTFGNGWGMAPNISHDGAAVVISGAGGKQMVQAKLKRSHSTREGFSWWLGADRPLTGEFLLTELLDIECVFDGQIQFSPNQMFYEWIQAGSGGKYLVRGKDWIGMLSFSHAVTPLIGHLQAFAFGAASLESGCFLVSVDSEECRGQTHLNQGANWRMSRSMDLPADRFETNRVHNEAWTLFRESGELKIQCPTCGGVIQFEVLSEFVHKSTCGCRRFNCVTKG